MSLVQSRSRPDPGPVTTTTHAADHEADHPPSSTTPSKRPSTADDPKQKQRHRTANCLSARRTNRNTGYMPHHPPASPPPGRRTGLLPRAWPPPSGPVHAPRQHRRHRSRCLAADNNSNDRRGKVRRLAPGGYLQAAGGPLLSTRNRQRHQRACCLPAHISEHHLSEKGQQYCLSRTMKVAYGFRRDAVGASSGMPHHHTCSAVDLAGRSCLSQFVSPCLGPSTPGPEDDRVCSGADLQRQLDRPCRRHT